MKDISTTVQAMREDFEQGHIDMPKLKLLYLRYNPIPDIDGFFRRAQTKFPECNCGIATLYLQDRLLIGDVVHGTYAGRGHTFLLIDGKTVVDITADQFGGPPVYIGPLQCPWSVN